MKRQEFRQVAGYRRIGGIGQSEFDNPAAHPLWLIIHRCEGKETVHHQFVHGAASEFRRAGPTDQPAAAA
jgi:hypothetical protein